MDSETSPKDILDREQESDNDSDDEFYDNLCIWDVKYDKEMNFVYLDENEEIPSSLEIEKMNNDSEFTLKFMLPKTAVDSLLTQIFSHITTVSNNKVSPLHQLLLTLRFYAIGSIPDLDFLDISKPTAMRIIQDVSEAIAKLDKEYIYIHKDNAEKFQKIAGFQQVFGIIGYTTVPLYNQSDITQANLEICVQAVCDADLRFMKFDVYWPGVPLEFVIMNTKHCFEANQFLLGDSNYPCKKYLLTPCANPSTDAEQRYNEAHIKTWKIIEKTFAAWKQRFTVVARPVRGSSWNINRIIRATAVLHNISRNQDLEEVPVKPETCKMTDDDFDESDDDDTERTKLLNNQFLIVE